MRPFEQIPLDEWTEVLKVNITGQMLCARAVLPAMRRAKWGRIINMSSGAVTLGRPGYLHYIASKSALIGMSHSMARELGPDGITVNAILPGAVFTEIERKTITPAQKERIIAQQCIGARGDAGGPRRHGAVSGVRRRPPSSPGRPSTSTAARRTRSA